MAETPTLTTGGAAEVEASPPTRRLRRRPPPPVLLLAGVAIAAAMALPLAYLLIVVGGSLGDAVETVWRERTLRLIVRSALLAAAVTSAAIALAVPLAWLTTRTDLPFRRLATVALALPLVIPSYIGAYVFVSALGPRGLLARSLEGPFGIDQVPSIYGFPGAWLVLTLFTYPLVLIPVRSALRRLDPALEDAALGLGRSRPAIFRTVVLPQLVPAIGGGALLVALYVLSDFGAVSILRFDSFTRVIYQSYRAGFDRVGAASLALLLVLMMILILWLEARARRGRAYHRSGPGTGRPAAVVPLGRWRWPAFAGCLVVIGLGLVLPVGVLVYWALQSVAGEVDWMRTWAAAGNSLLAAGLAAAAAAVCAVPVALLSVRHPGRASAVIDRLSHTGYALPGIVVALALVFFGIRLATPLYQTLAMLVFAFVVLFLPLAIGSTRTALLQISPRLEEAARSVGRRPAVTLATITGRLAMPGILAGAALVFLTAVKELPATLILSPIGFETLATEIWQQTRVAFFERGAIPALLLLAISAPPLYFLIARDER